MHRVYEEVRRTRNALSGPTWHPRRPVVERVTIWRRTSTQATNGQGSCGRGGRSTSSACNRQLYPMVTDSRRPLLFNPEPEVQHAHMLVWTLDLGTLETRRCWKLSQLFAHLVNVARVVYSILWKMMSLHGVIPKIWKNCQRWDHLAEIGKQVCFTRFGFMFRSPSDQNSAVAEGGRCVADIANRKGTCGCHLE